jgi:hypothetical protein
LLGLDHGDDLLGDIVSVAAAGAMLRVSLDDGRRDIVLAGVAKHSDGHAAILADPIDRIPRARGGRDRREAQDFALPVVSIHAPAGGATPDR